MTRSFVRFTCALLLALAALPAGAHPFHAAAGFASGFAHPFLGIDHLLAMVAVGIIAVQQGGSVWRLPLAFCVAMTAGSRSHQQASQHYPWSRWWQLPWSCSAA